MPDPSVNPVRLQLLVDQAMGLPEPERAAFVRRASGGDAALCAAALAQLALQSSSRPKPRFFGSDREAAADADQGLPVELQGLRVGQRVGDFTLVRFLGKGGMGQVWEARQESLRKLVALKLLLPDRIDDRALELFVREARAGGKCHHPNLVATLSRGEDQGIAWLAQELVADAQTLADALERFRGLDQLPQGYHRQVASLVEKVARGMQAAHDAGVVHRDLKPQNILIGGDDEPRVADFGLARVTGDSVASKTGDFAGTYFYMSPEQVMAKRAGLDHRTDVFSLGVVLYELLTLQRPFLGDTGQQIAQQITMWDPPRADTVRSQCPRDLGVIAEKAMQKASSQRYPSMAALAEDLHRYLSDLPILAKPTGRLERARKWVRRNPTVSATMGSVFAGAVVAGWLALAEAEARQQAQQNEQRAVASEQVAAQRAEENARLAAAEAQAKEKAQRMATELKAVVDFQSRQLGTVDAWQLGQDLRESIRQSLARGMQSDGAVEPSIGGAVATFDSTTRPVDFTGVVLQWLESGYFKPTLEAIDAQFEDQELLQARLLHVVSGSMRDLGISAMALDAQKRALAIRERLLGPAAAETLDSRNNYANLLFDEGALDRAEQELRATISLGETVDGRLARDTITSRASLGAVLMAGGKPEQAAEVLGEALALARREFGMQDSLTVGLLHNLGQAMGTLGRHEEAIALAEEAVQAARGAQGADERREALSLLHGLGKLMAEHGDTAKAEQVLREALGGLVAESGADHPNTLATMSVLLNLLLEEGRPEDAEPLLQKYVEGRKQRSLGVVDRVALVAMDKLGVAWMNSGNHDKAVSWLREAVTGLKLVQGPEATNTLFAVNHLGSALFQKQSYQEAHDMFAAALAGLSKVLGEHDRETLICRVSLAVSKSKLDQEDEALQMLAMTFSDATKHLGEDDSLTMHAFSQMVVLQVNRGRGSEAKSLLADWLARTSLAKDHPVVVAMRELHDSIEDD